MNDSAVVDWNPPPPPVTYSPLWVSAKPGQELYWRWNDPRWGSWGKTPQQMQYPINDLWEKLIRQAGFTGGVYKPWFYTVINEWGGGEEVQGGLTYTDAAKSAIDALRARGFDLARKHPDRRTYNTYWGLFTPDGKVQDIKIEGDDGAGNLLKIALFMAPVWTGPLAALLNVPAPVVSAGIKLATGADPGKVLVSTLAPLAVDTLLPSVSVLPDTSIGPILPADEWLDAPFVEPTLPGFDIDPGFVVPTLPVTADTVTAAELLTAPALLPELDPIETLGPTVIPPPPVYEPPPPVYEPPPPVFEPEPLPFYEPPAPVYEPPPPVFEPEPLPFYEPPPPVYEPPPPVFEPEPLPFYEPPAPVYEPPPPVYEPEPLPFYEPPAPPVYEPPPVLVYEPEPLPFYEPPAPPIFETEVLMSPVSPAREWVVMENGNAYVKNSYGGMDYQGNIKTDPALLDVYPEIDLFIPSPIDAMPAPVVELPPVEMMAPIPTIDAAPPAIEPVEVFAQPVEVPKMDDDEFYWRGAEVEAPAFDVDFSDPFAGVEVPEFDVGYWDEGNLSDLIITYPEYGMDFYNDPPVLPGPPIPGETYPPAYDVVTVDDAAQLSADILVGGSGGGVVEVGGNFAPNPDPGNPGLSVGQVLRDANGIMLEALKLVDSYRRLTNPPPPNRVTQARVGSSTVRATPDGMIVTTDASGRTVRTKPPVGQPQMTTDGSMIVNNGDGTYTSISPSGAMATNRYPTTGAAAASSNYTTPLLIGGAILALVALTR